MSGVRINRSVVVAIVIALGLGAWLFSGTLGGGGNAPQHANSGNGAVRANNGGEETLQSVRVRTLRAELRRADLTVRGRTEAIRDVEVRAETAGSVAGLPIEKGSTVQEGDVICQLANEARDAQLAEARALMRQRDLEVRAAQELAKRGFRSDTQVAQAQAAFEAAQASFRRMQVEVERTRVRAPFDGILDDRPVEIGDYLRAGEVCGVVVDPDPVLVVGFVSERDISKLRQGGNGYALLVGGARVEGTIRFVATQAESATRTFRVELAVPNPDGTIRQGVTAEMKLPVAELEAHVLSPAILTLNDAGELGVRTVNADNVVQFRPVTIIEDLEDGVVVSGLPNEVTVITVGQEFVSEGQKVEVFPDETGSNT